MTNWKEGAPKHPKGGRGRKTSDKKDKQSSEKREKSSDGIEKQTTEKREKSSEGREKSPGEKRRKSVTKEREESPTTGAGTRSRRASILKKKTAHAEKRWSKVGHVQRAVSDLHDRLEKVEGKTSDEAQDEGNGQEPPPTEPQAGESEPQATETGPNEAEAGTKEAESEPQQKEAEKTGDKKGAKAQTPASGGQAKKEEAIVEEEDPHIVLRNKILETVKNGFSIAKGEDGEIQLSVDNVYPLLKALGLNPQNESVMDMVRDACMESYGDIPPAQFEEVVLSLVKVQDDELWGERLAEKKRDALKESSEKAKAEAERLKKIEQGEIAEEEEEESWEEIERKMEQKKQEQELERKTDELYDNMKMAFRFIDSDEDGVISTKDVYNLMMGLGEMLDDDELYGMVTMADLDCDGKLTFKDFKRFLLKGTPNEIGSDDDEDAPPKTKPPVIDETPTDEPPEAETEEAKTDEVEDSAEKAEEEKEGPRRRFAVAEVKEDASERAKRRKSMLFGYKSVVSAMDDKPKDKIEKEDENDQKDKTEEEKTESPTPKTDLDAIAEAAKQTEEAINILNAIREEDEHSNYDGSEDNAVNIENEQNEQKSSIRAESRRRQLPRQGSSASLRNKPNSVIANSESTMGDSRFETLDTNIDCSEIREVPDVFDISDDESELQNLASSRGSKSRETGVEDEDKIDDECVRESLSRFSNLPEDSSESSDDESAKKTDAKTRSYSRAGEFSNEYMYYELDESPTEEQKQQRISEEIKTKIRFTRAQMLQNAIFKRANTVPELIRYVPKPPSAKNTNVNGITCSHIDIDLRCEIPPKADIKSLRQFTDRVQSARTRPKSAYFDKAFLERKMSIVDMTDTLAENLDSEVETKWLSWPRTARSPRPPRHAHGETERKTPRQRRTQSAVPRMHGSDRSLSPVSRDRQTPRPQTANMTYTAPRRTIPDLNCAKLQKMGEFTVVTSEPFAKSDQLYPRKSLLTSYHHGFRSIWPIGRKINVLQDKRPFESFEMNSYSRSIERQEIPPLKVDGGFENKENFSPRATPWATKTIQLELDTKHIAKPKLKRLPSLLPCTFTPRTVR